MKSHGQAWVYWVLAAVFVIAVYRKFKKSIIIKKQQKFVNPPLPIVKPKKELFDCFDEVFVQMMADVDGFSTDEVKSIHKIIKRKNFLNLTFIGDVQEKYFDNRNWSWGEYNRWDEICKGLGRYPVKLGVFQRYVHDTPTKILSLLSIKELKVLCGEYDINFNSKYKKNDFICVLEIIPNVLLHKTVQDVISDAKERFQHELCSLLFYTMSGRAHSLYKRRERKNIGITEWEIKSGFKEDEEFIKIVLKQNPKAIPPFFPGDFSREGAIIKGLNG